MKKILIAIAILLGVGAIGAGVWYFVVHAPPRRPDKTVTTEVPNKGLLEPAWHSEHTLAAAVSVAPAQPSPTVEVFESPQMHQIPLTEKKMAPMRIYTSNAPPEPEVSEEPKGAYAPAYRLIRCQTVNAIDSSLITTPIIGTVTNDLIWGGRMIIPCGSEVHGTALVDKSRERIASEGVWTFTIHDPERDDREIVLKGMALDRDVDSEPKKMMVGSTVVDPSVKSWGLTDMSAGIRGVVLKSTNASELEAIVATFAAGFFNSFQATQDTIFGPVSSPNATGVGGASGAVINPPLQGAQAVMARYAQTITDSIEKDGFFIRVAPHKSFYVYVTEDINMGKASAGGAGRLNEVQNDYLQDRKLQEKVTEPRGVRERREDERSRSELQQPVSSGVINSLDQTAQRLQQQSMSLSEKSQSLNPGPAAQ